MKISKDFQLEEFIPKEIYSKLGKRSIVLLDNRIIHVAQALREVYGEAFINEWMTGGNANWRGWRPWWCPIGAHYSQHKFGRAVDLTFKNKLAKEIREDIRENQAYWYNVGIRRVEESTRYLHVDLCETGLHRQVVFFEPES
jgi:hypothetical protein